MSTRDQVKVHMEYRLARVRAIVHSDVEARDTFVSCEPAPSYQVIF